MEKTVTMPMIEYESYEGLRKIYERQMEEEGLILQTDSFICHANGVSYHKYTLIKPDDVIKALNDELKKVKEENMKLVAEKIKSNYTESKKKWWQK